jgi:hypothetical protein
LLKQTNQEYADPRSACLADVRELCTEFQQAISAVASDDVETLENGIAAQERLVDQLQNCLQRKVAVETNPARHNTAELPSELRDLINLARVYSGLLRRSMRSVGLRTALCRTFKQNFAGLPRERANNPTWSCEA